MAEENQFGYQEAVREYEEEQRDKEVRKISRRSFFSIVGGIGASVGVMTYGMVSLAYSKEPPEIMKRYHEAVKIREELELLKEEDNPLKNPKFASGNVKNELDKLFKEDNKKLQNIEEALSAVNKDIAEMNNNPLVKTALSDTSKEISKFRKTVAVGFAVGAGIMIAGGCYALRALTHFKRKYGSEKPQKSL